MIDVIAAVQTKLEELPALNYIDEDWGQLDYYSPNFPVKWPCALVDVAAAQYSDIGRDSKAVPVNRQQGDAILRITLANLRLTNTGNKAPQSQKDHARSIWAMAEDVHKIIQGWSPGGNIGALTRQGVRRNKRDDGVQEYELLYGFAAHNV